MIESQAPRSNHMNTGNLSNAVRDNLGHRISQGRNMLEALESIDHGEGPWKRYIDALDEILERLQKSVLHVAVLGQFKRGKSTLINALLGSELLPSALLPLTSVPTLVRYGERAYAALKFKDGSSKEIEIEKLSEFVTEQGNPANERGVERADLYCDTPILAGGIVIIDTPGIGSTFTHNTDVTIDFLPHCDLGLFLTSPDPPLTEVEVEFLNLVSRRVTHLIFILNKIDSLSPEGLEEVGGFLEKMLGEKTGYGSDCRIFPVSALRGLEGRKAGDDTKWKNSGMKMLEDYLRAFFLKEKEPILCAALSLKADAIFEEARASLELRINALESPLDNLTKKIEELSSLEVQVKEERLRIRDALEAEQRRLIQEISTRTELLEQEGIRRIGEGISSALSAADKRLGYKRLSHALRAYLDAAIPAFFMEKKEQFIQESCALAEERLTLLLKKTDDLIIRVNKEALAIFEVKAPPPLREPFSLKWPNFYWEHIIFSCGLFEVVKKIVYHVLPCRALRNILTREALEEAENLILRNAGKLRYSVIDGLERVVKRLNSRLISELEHALCDTRKAALDALNLRQEKNESVAPLIVALKEKKSLL
jgi:hypothetical protein